ncbi:MAG: DUF4091 domain-containing protein [Phycisphaerae bacterium]|nr:DUF4091 domain-containing protein [Phycisphaerae bacterium]
MKTYRIQIGLMVVLAVTGVGVAETYLEQAFGERLPGSSPDVDLWWASSGWKVGVDKAAPEAQGTAILIRAAQDESEAAQVVIHPARTLTHVSVQVTDLQGPDRAVIASQCVDVLRVGYVHVTQPTDDAGAAGHWPDPLPPWKDGTTIAAHKNQPLWIRVHVPRDIPAGLYCGTLEIRADDFHAAVPLHVAVYGFTLPEQMTCVTAFGFSPENVFQYQKLQDSEQRREVLDKYWANFSAHHISPYNPAPLDPIRVQWPAIQPPPSAWDDWDNLRRVDNECHEGRQAALVFDADPQANVTLSYKPLIPIPTQGLRIRFWYRTAVPGQEFNVAMNHYDGQGQWISGRNQDMTFAGDGHWQEFDATVTEFPEQARSVRFMARATPWTESGEDIGLVWFDDLSITNPETGEAYMPHGDFESELRTAPLRPAAELRPALDFTAWDRAMTRTLNEYHFNSFRLSIPGIGGGTFHARSVPSLLGFTEETPEYPILFEAYCRQIESHLAEKGWLDKAFVYWFDEPLPKDYDYVMNGFARLKQAAPDITRMLTVMEGVDERLYGGPEIWCAISNKYDHTVAQQRRLAGETFWWYICTGPKAPYCTLFIDHPGTALRAWLWQTWQRNIEGILVWQTNYWTSPTAYPNQPQNPYEDPMGWCTGYGIPLGEKRAWGNGDGRFIYPPEAAAQAQSDSPVLAGPVDSIRWEMLRDGIEDYEYMALLKRLIQARKETLTPDQHRHYSVLLSVPDEITSDMTHFTEDPAPIEAHRHKVARAIEELVRR